MTFSKYSLLLFLLLLTFHSCETEDIPKLTSKLVASPSSLQLLGNEKGKFLLSAQPVGSFQWSVSSKPDWISVSPDSGLVGDELVEIEVLPNTEGLTAGTHSGMLELVSNGAGKVSVDIQILVEDPPVSILAVSQGELEFDFSENSKDFYVINEGGTDYDWTIENSNSDLSIVPSTGFLTAGDSTKVSVTVNREQLLTQVYEWPIMVLNGQNDPVGISIVVNSFKEEKWLLESGEIIDAEYDRNDDKLVTVSIAPNHIRKYDLVSETVETLVLNLPPTCVSISQDGKYAAVGHDGKISHIDLSTMQLIDIFDVSTDVFDIILAPNDWVYAFPKVDQWETIRCIDLSTKQETLHTGNSIRAGTRVKLHPSGDFIYGADNGLSPSDFEKYDITMGVAQYMYDSPYHGDFAFDGNIWISENGEKLFSRSRNIFNATNSESTDMRYSGSLVGSQDERVAALDHHEESNIVYAVFESGYNWESNPGSIVKKYTADFYNFQGDVMLPQFFGTDIYGNERLFDSKGHFVFFNSSGTEFYAVVRASEIENSSVRWAIATLPVN